jgi:4-diphosphocytidyl-2-C-methyl-D-erythritol kinase
MIACSFPLGNPHVLGAQWPPMPSLTLRAPAKINLFLRVVARRPDGYHEIDSLMVPIALFDTLILKLRPATSKKSMAYKYLSLVCPGHPDLESPANLAYQAALRYFKAAGRTPSLNIMIKKRIPIAGGLGGGSSDAGTVLLGLDRLLATVPRPQLHSLATSLGADVPFFLESGPCRARGIGDLLEPVLGLPGFWVVLACAPFGLATRKVYESLNFPLTRLPDSDRQVPSGGGRDLADLARQLVNDLQPIGEGFQPAIGRVRDSLLKAGALGASMSGSGPSVFGLYGSRRLAMEARNRIRKERGWTYLVARGITTNLASARYTA